MYSEHVFVNVALPQDGLNPDRLPPPAAAGNPRRHESEGRGVTARAPPRYDPERPIAAVILAAHAPVAELVDAQG